MRTAALVKRNVPPSKSGVSCDVGLGRHRAQPDRPGRRRARAAADRSGSPGRRSRARRTARRRAARRRARGPSTVEHAAADVAPVGDHERDAARRARAAAARRTRRCPRRSTRARRARSTVAARRKNGSPSGSTQSPSTAVVTRPLGRDGARFGRAAAAGGEFSSGSRTVTVDARRARCRRARRRRCSRTRSSRMPSSSSVSCSCWLSDDEVDPRARRAARRRRASTTSTSPFAS